MTIVIGCLVLLLVAGVTPMTEEQKQRLEPYSQACKPETGAPDDLIQRGRNGDLVDDIRIKKQILCIMKKLGLVNATGDPVAEKYKETVKNAGVTDEEATRIVEKCVVKHDTPEDTVFKIAKCLYEREPKWSPVS